MLGTLQLYITRELVKTFVLTAIGLTLVFSLCGGVFNMIEAEVLTAVQIAKILGFILPIATTLTLPVSSLFACAIVYGRFASDNEIDACKASGVNIHRLLAPAVGLSVFTAVFTFVAINFVIPRFATRLEAIIRQDIQKVAMQALSSKGHLRWGPYVVYARSCTTSEDSASKVLNLVGAAFLIMEKDNLSSCGTAEQVAVDFSAGKDGNPAVRASMYGVRRMDLERNQLDELNAQSFKTMSLPSKIEQKPKLLDLWQLLYYRKHPTEFVEVQDRMFRTREQVRKALFYRYAVEQLTGDEKVLQLKSDRRRLTIQAKRVVLDRIDSVPTIDNATVVEEWDGRRRDYVADRCSIRVKRGFGDEPDMVHVKLQGNVSFVDSLDPTKKNEPKEIDLEDVPVPAHVAKKEKQLSDVDLLGFQPSEFQASLLEDFSIEDFPSLGLGERIDDARISTARDVIKLGLEITGIVHSRLAFSAGSLVTLVLAAGLAIVFRGGQLLTAFVISFIPGMLLVVINIMGRQLAENANTALLGVMVIWAGIALLAVTDGVVLVRYLRR